MKKRGIYKYNAPRRSSKRQKKAKKRTCHGRTQGKKTRKKEKEKEGPDYNYGERAILTVYDLIP